MGTIEFQFTQGIHGLTGVKEKQQILETLDHIDHFFFTAEYCSNSLALGWHRKTINVSESNHMAALIYANGIKFIIHSGRCQQDIRQWCSFCHCKGRSSLYSQLGPYYASWEKCWYSPSYYWLKFSAALLQLLLSYKTYWTYLSIWSYVLFLSNPAREFMMKKGLTNILLPVLQAEKACLHGTVACCVTVPLIITWT